MKFFTEDYLEFFKELAANNHKDWFDANRKRYEKNVKKPFKTFTEVMIRRMQEDDPSIKVEPKQCIFRINRDIRFSKDKTPYKTSQSAAISRGGRKDTSYPGLYYELGPGAVKLYGGVYMPDKKQLENIRHYIANNPKQWQQAANDKGFVKHFGPIQGEQSKRLPKELQQAADKEPIIYNKQFYYSAELPPETILKKDLDTVFMEYHRAAKPVRNFLIGALGP